MKRKMAWLTVWLTGGHEVRIELRPNMADLPYVQALYQDSKGKPHAIRLDNEALLAAVKDAQRRKVK